MTQRRLIASLAIATCAGTAILGLYQKELTVYPPRQPPETIEFCGKTISTQQAVVRCDEAEVDLEPLRMMRVPLRLDLAISGVRDLSPLRGVPLESLNISGTDVEDLSPIAHAVTLRELRVASDRISSLAVLNTLPQLEILEVHSATVRDLSPLRSVPHLRSLTLGNLRYPEPEAIGELSELENLDIGACRFESMDFVRNLARLKRLVIHYSPISELVLPKGSELRILELTFTRITNIEAVSRLEHLERLSLQRSPVNTIEGVKFAESLATLDLVGTQVPYDEIRSFKGECTSCMVHW